MTAAGLVATNKGPRIVILHQYAYLGTGKTIHCCGQLESYKNDVCDKSPQLGGKSRLETLDGVTIPFNMRNGLSYMDMRPPTDDEFENLPHITLTSDVVWDPATLDHEFDSSNDFAASFPADNYVHNPDFNDKGEYIANHLGQHVIEAADANDVATCPALIPRTIEEDECDEDDVNNDPSLTVPSSTLAPLDTRFYMRNENGTKTVMHVGPLTSRPTQRMNKFN